MLKKVSSAIVDVLLPQECLGCGVAKTWLCEKCARSLPVTQDAPCFVCQQASLNGEIHAACQETMYLDGVLIASSRSHHLLKELIRAFKYDYLQALTAPLANLLTQKVSGLPAVEAVLMNPDALIVPVPLHKKREWERGYNQAALLAQELAQVFPAQLSLDSVRRVKKTKTQTGYHKQKRLRNLQDAFEVVDEDLISDQTIILIDDVVTSGATLNELARSFKGAGSKEIWALVLSRG